MAGDVHHMPVAELQALKICIRNYRACVAKVAKAKDKRTTDYWARACTHWDAEIVKFLPKHTGLFLPSVKQMIDQFTANIEHLRKEVDPLIVDDLLYRFGVIVESIQPTPTDSTTVGKPGHKPFDKDFDSSHYPQ